MFITPLILLPLVAFFADRDLFEAAEDPVFILTAVLIISSPPAIVRPSPSADQLSRAFSSHDLLPSQTLAQITQAASGDAFERLISKTISVSYGILTPPLTLLYVVLGQSSRSTPLPPSTRLAQS